MTVGQAVNRPYSPEVLASWLEKCLPPSGLAFERSASSPGSPSRAWLETGSCTFPSSGVPVAHLHPDDERQHDMVLIGIDPHKGSHTAVAIDRDETKLGELRLRSSKQQCDRLLDWAAIFPDRRWAIESAGGLGYLLAQQLVAAGEDVVDVPPTLSSRGRVLGSGKAQKNDPNDALSTAIAALRGRGLRHVEADDHVAIIRMLANRRHDVVALHTQAVCRLHAQLANLSPGGVCGPLSPARAAALLAGVRPVNGVVAERKRQAQ